MAGAIERFDLIIIGSGQGGTYLAGRAAEAGWRVALVERDRLGGSCVNYGCTPSKTLLASAHLAGRMRRAGALCVTAEPTVDVEGVMKRVRSVREQWRDSVREICETEGLEVVRGEGRFVRSDDHDGPRVQVGERLLGAERIVIDTGTRPLVPDVDGLDDTPFRTNEEIFELERLPRRLAIVGGGYIGMELGQGFARLGGDAIDVTIIESSERPLATESEAVSSCLRQSLEDDGVRFLVGRELSSARHDGSCFTLEARAVDDEDPPVETLEVDELLVAVGRRPNVEALELDAVGIELDDDGTIAIDDRYRTSADGVYAIGEVAGRPAFTHVSTEDGRRLESRWLGGSEPAERDRTSDDRTLAYAAFTDPQLGRVGLDAEQAREAGHAIRCVHKPLGETSRGIEWGRDRGFFELVASEESGEILGATFVGEEAAELVQLLLPAIDLGLTAAQLARSGFIHPTFSEDLRSLFFELAGD